MASNYNVLKQISNSKLDLYTTCGKKFYFKYIEKLEADVTRSPLLYGRAMDEALNYILLCKKDNIEFQPQKAKDIFIEKMNEWSGQNRLDYFKNEIPEELQDNPDSPELQEQVWNNICQRGLNSIDVFIKDVLPTFKRIIDVQIKRIEKNADEDELIFIVDFIAETQEGKIVLFDNKTSSSKYTKNSVKESQQLALYSEYYPECEYAGYIVLIKNPEKLKGCTHQIIIDKVLEETKQKAFDELEKTLYNIKIGKFEKNEKKCMAFGKPCEYMGYCKNNNMNGLIKRESKK